MTDIIAVSDSTHSLQELPTPASYKVIPNQIFSENTARDVMGDLHMDLLTTKRKISMTWLNITPEDFADIMERTSATELHVTCYDPTIAGYYSGLFVRDASLDYQVVGPWRDKPLAINVTGFSLTEI